MNFLIWAVVVVLLVGWAVYLTDFLTATGVGVGVFIVGFAAYRVFRLGKNAENKVEDDSTEKINNAAGYPYYEQFPDPMNETGYSSWEYEYADPNDDLVRESEFQEDDNHSIDDDWAVQNDDGSAGDDWAIELQELLTDEQEQK